LVIAARSKRLEFSQDPADTHIKAREGLIVTRSPFLLLIALASIGLHAGCKNSGERQRVSASPLGLPARLDPAVSAANQSRGRTSVSAIPASVSPSSIAQVGRRGEDDDGLLTADNTGVPRGSGSSAPADSADLALAPSMALADLEAFALQCNPTLAQAQAAIDQEQGTYRQAGLYPNPQLGYLNGSASNPAVRQSNGIFLSQEIVTAKKLGLAQQSSAQELKRFQWDLEAQRMRVLNDLKIRYYEVLGAQEAVAVAHRLVKFAEESLNIAEELWNAKQGTRSDVLQAKVQLETIRLGLDEAEHRYAAAWEQLATIAGMSPMQPVPLADNLAGEIPRLELETRWQELLVGSPQLRSTESELDHGRATYREALAQAIPNVTLQTVAEYDRATQATTVSTLVALPLPIYNRNQGNIDKASADIRADQAEICRVQLVLRDQLVDSFRRYQTSLRQTERLREAILPSAEENMRLAKQLYSAGETAFAPVLIAQQTYFQSQVAYVEALTELHKVVAEIEGLQLTGGLNPAAIGSAIQNQAGGGAQRQRALLNQVQDRASKQLLPAAQLGQ
jgi:cobalt-zinc-cadmium efflux system outer membrane protein